MHQRMLKTTPLHRFVELARAWCPAGHRMPVQYPSAYSRHLHTRAAAGLFDVSYGQIVPRAKPGDAERASALERLVRSM
jgi:aminomethyltransferase